MQNAPCDICSYCEKVQKVQKVHRCILYRMRYKATQKLRKGCAWGEAARKGGTGFTALYRMRYKPFRAARYVVIKFVWVYLGGTQSGNWYLFLGTKKGEPFGSPCPQQRWSYLGCFFNSFRKALPVLVILAALK